MAKYTIDLQGNVTENATQKKKKKNRLKYQIDLDGNVTRVGATSEKETTSPNPLTLKNMNMIAGITAEQKRKDALSVENQEEEKKETWFNNPYKDLGKMNLANYGDFIYRTVEAGLGTGLDAVTQVAKGAGSMVEGIKDLATYGVAGVADLFGADEWADKRKKEAQVSDMDTIFGGVEDYLAPYSFLGEKGKQVPYIVGDVVSAMLPAKLIGAAGKGASAAGKTANAVDKTSKATNIATNVVRGTSVAGHSMSEAYNSGASDMEAVTYAGINTAGELVSEWMFGGLGKGANVLGYGKGLSSADDILAKKVSGKINNQIAKNFVEYGIKAGAEGTEELMSGIISAFGKKLSYMSEEELGKIVKDEKLLDQFVMGTVVSGIMQSGYVPGMTQGSLKEANRTATDFITGYTVNEQKVVDAEVKSRIEAEEKDGKKLSKKEKAAIEEEVTQDMQKGRISIDAIERALGGDTYESHKALTEEMEEYKKLNQIKGMELTGEQSDRLAELKEKNRRASYETETKRLKEQLSKEVSDMTLNDTYLQESYNERGRRSQEYTADISQYDEKMRDTIQRAIDSKILNNTNRTHEFVDLIAKISADKGVSFDFTNNENLKNSGFALNGVTVNGFVEGGNITLNTNSAKALNKVVGHEITHVLEGTEHYDPLAQAVQQYAKEKGEYQTRYDALKSLYEKAGKNLSDTEVEAELTADLVGDYIFADEKFVRQLSTQNRNIFQKVYDEVKYLAKTVTAGTKEAKQLLKAKKLFEQVYRENAKVDTKKTGEVQYSLNVFEDGKQFVEIDQEQERFDGHDRSEYPSIAKQIINEKFNGKVVGQDNKMYVNGRGRDEYIHPSKPIKDNYVYDAKMRASGEIDNLLDAGERLPNEADGKDGHVHKNALEWEYYKTLFKVGDNYFEGVVNIEVTNRGKLFKDVTKIKDVTEAIMNSYGENPKFQFLRTSSNNIVADNQKNATENKKFSLSETMQTDTEEFKNWFGNSKVVDKDGNPLVVYHGTNDNFTVFDSNITRSKRLNFGKGFYFATKRSSAEMYTETRNVMEVYLSATTPYEVYGTTFDNSDYRRISEMTGENVTSQNVTEVLKRAGYDSIIARSYDGNTNPINQIVVFESNQIKSATDNIGTFDKDNPDIRYSVSEKNKDIAPLPKGWEVKGKDIALDHSDEIAPVRKDIAPAQKNSTTYMTDGDVTAYLAAGGRENKKRRARYESGDQIIIRNRSDLDVYIKNAIENDGLDQFAVYGKVSNELADKVYQKSGGRVDIHGFYKELSSSDLWHTYREHHIAKEEGDIDLTVEDIIKSVDTIDQFEVDKAVKRTDGRTTIELSKQDEDGTIVNIEVVSKSAGVIRLKTEWKMENSKYAEKNNRSGSDSVGDISPATTRSDPASTNSISETAENTTEKNLKIRKDEKLRIKSLESEIKGIEVGKEESTKQFDEVISRLQAEYEALRRKDTKKASKLLQRIAKEKASKEKVIEEIDFKIEERKTKIGKIKDGVAARYRKNVQQELRNQARELIGDTSTWKDKKLGFFYQTHTLRENLEDIVKDPDGNKDYEKAHKIYDWTQGSYNHNEAALKRRSREIKAPLKELNLNRVEDVYAQMFGEYKYNPDTTLTPDIMNEYYDKHKEKINQQKVDKAIEYVRHIYDDILPEVNAVLRHQGIREIEYRQGYFPHFTEEKRGFFSKLLNWNTKNNDVPTDIAGMTEYYKPERSWQSFNKRRTSDDTVYSLTKGFDTYIHGALDWIYHIEDIQRRRALENEIRFQHSDNGIKYQINEIYQSDELNADQVQEAIDKVLETANNPLHNFVQDLRKGTNNLAGKKDPADRALEYRLNREIYSTLTNINNRISANQVVMSISSAISNIAPVIQSWLQINPVTSVLVMKDTIQSYMKDDGVVNKSTYMTNRLRLEENLYQTNWDKISNGAGFMMNAVDDFATQVVWRSKYYENMKSGMSEQEAIQNADLFTEDVQAGRSRGNMPTLFNEKSFLIKIFTMFNLEVNHQYRYMFKNAPRDMKSKGIAHITMGYVKMFIGSYVFNAITESIIGRSILPDPIRIMEDLLNDLGVLGGDDEEDEDDGWIKALTNLAENVLQEIPFIGGLLGGGRIPTASALPYGGIGMDQWDEFMQDIESGNGLAVTKEMLKPLWYVGFPMGGGQIKKSIEGLMMFDDDLPIAGSYTDSGKLRFSVEDDIPTRIQAALFGQYASKNARRYFDEGRTPLTEKQTKELVEMDIPIGEYWDIKDKKQTAAAVGEGYQKHRNKIKSITSDKDEDGNTIAGSRKDKVITYINNLDMTRGERLLMFKTEYPKDDTYNVEIVEYLNDRKDLSSEDRKTILKELGFEVDSDGTVRW